MPILDCCSNDHEVCQYPNNLSDISVCARYLFGAVSLSGCVSVIITFYLVYRETLFLGS